MPNTNNIDRRTLIHHLLKSGLALGLMPGFGEAAWSAVATGSSKPAPALDAKQNSMIAVVADAVLPRSDTPGAADLGVVPWIEVIVSDYFPAERRAIFLDDLKAMDDFALAKSGARLAALKGDALGAVMASLDAACGKKDQTPAQRGYVQLKELIVYGYFTSKPVQQDILKVVIIPGRFDGNVLIRPAIAT
jgi:hypothetical protein